MAPVRSSELLSGTLTRSLTPSNDSAPPNLPAVVQTAPEIVPGLLLPDRSATVVPPPASKLYAAARPVGGGGATLLPVTVPPADVAAFPELSVATAVNL